VAESGKGGRYHHGDLRAALIDTAVQLIAERGVRGFSLAEGRGLLGQPSSRRVLDTGRAPREESG
jgi:hypothetical protein